MVSLYQCGNAKVTGTQIKCSAGHILSARRDGCLDTIRLARGDALELGICQSCHDLDLNGDPVLKEDRGWLKK